ncbi:hypothetical protein L596_024761 [Steinernema carpocapsae]|uniref:non-specific serine/threonine protein kinase n=1 Tax=Steinernema carpocapsae TaxID=34508 RepID=A0A4U5M5P1_STECR|nr:hypothetical protein L596_024761 [Steinernema carpocapsae]
MPPPNKRRERGHNGESRRRHFEDDDEELSKNVDVKSSAEETDKKKAKKRQSGRRRERRRSHDGRKKGKKSRNEKLEDKGFHRVNISDLDEVSSRSLSKEDAPPGQEPKPMNVGDRVLSGTRTFEIVKLLGCGGFGEVYKVQLVGAPGQFFAMKTELRYLHASQNRLKKDVQVFEDIEETKANLKHFVRMVDKGMTNKYKFIVMTLTGPSLTEIRNERLRADFSRSTAIRVAMQTLQCVHDIHALGYVHRDVKPSNFTIGPPPKTNVIFVLDFGISKKIKGGLKCVQKTNETGYLCKGRLERFVTRPEAPIAPKNLAAGTTWNRGSTCRWNSLIEKCSRGGKWYITGRFSHTRRSSSSTNTHESTERFLSDSAS